MAKIVFMGSPAFAVPSLQALAAEEHEIMAVYTQPPRPAGRGQKLQKTAVHVMAEEMGLPVFHPEKLRGADLEAVLEIQADVFCVVAYGLLLPKALVDSRLCLNVHPSALPLWRGAAPLQWTLMSGATHTEVCVMKLDEGMDTGPVVVRQEIGIPRDWNRAKLEQMTADVGAMLLAEVVDNLKGIRPIPQAGEATHAVKITKEMRPIAWQMSAQEIANRIRGLSPTPTATAQLGDEVFKVFWAETVDGYQGVPGEVLAVDAGGIVVACGDGAVRLVKIRRPNGTANIADAGAIARGWAEMRVGARLA